MSIQVTAELKDGRLVLPFGLNLGLPDGASVTIAILDGNPADTALAPSRMPRLRDADPAAAAALEADLGVAEVLPRKSNVPLPWPEDEPAALRSPRLADPADADFFRKTIRPAEDAA